MTTPFIPDPPFALTALERKDPVWVKLRAYMEKRITNLRTENDDDLDERKTADVRGQIKALKLLISLDRDPRITE